MVEDEGVGVGGGGDSPRPYAEDAVDCNVSNYMGSLSEVHCIIMQGCLSN